jgi:hypothetical protein
MLFVPRFQHVCLSHSCTCLALSYKNPRPTMLIYQKQAHIFPTLNLAIIGTDPTRYLVEQISQERGVFQQIMLNIAKWHLFY